MIMSSILNILLIQYNISLLETNKKRVKKQTESF